MIHTNFYLRSPGEVRETPIFMKLYFDNQSFKYPALLKISPQYWDFDKQRAKPSRKVIYHLELNTYLENLHKIAVKSFWELKEENGGKSPTIRELKAAMDKKAGRLKVEKLTFIGFLDKMIRESEMGTRVNPQTGKQIHPNTIKTYQTSRNHLLKFQKIHRRSLDFDDIRQDFYSIYTEFLAHNIKLSTNTIGKHIQVIKLIMNEAFEAGITNNLSHKNKHFITVKEPAESIYLNKEELKEIEILDLSENKNLEKVRDLFLIGCYTGLRYSDYSTLTTDKIRDGFIRGVQIKTGDPVTIPLHDTVIKILEKYTNRLPKSFSNQKTNKYLKEIGKKVPLLETEIEKTFTKASIKNKVKFKKWELLTTHTARRSFATNEFIEGTPTLTIMAITGHKTEKAFLRYIKLSSADHAKLLKEQWALRKKKTLSI